MMRKQVRCESDRKITVSAEQKVPGTCLTPFSSVTSASSVLSFWNLCIYIFHPIWEMFGNYFSKYFFCSIFLLKLQLSMPDLLYCPQSHSFYFQPSYFLFFRLCTSCGSVFRFSDSFFCHLQSAAKPIVDENKASPRFKGGGATASP